MFEIDILRSRMMVFRVTEEERQAIIDEAKRRGLTMTNTIRLALGKLIKEKETSESNRR